MIDPRELEEWMQIQLAKAWPDTELTGYAEHDGNCDFRISAEEEHWLKLGYRIVLEGTNEELTAFLSEAELDSVAYGSGVPVRGHGG